MNSAYTLESPSLLTNRTFGLRFIREAPLERRRGDIAFHVSVDDYFGTLATILGLVAETKDTRPLNDLRDELVYMQETYEIKRKH